MPSEQPKDELAFPTPIVWNERRGHPTDGNECYPQGGMMLSDYFAAHALQGLLANDPANHNMTWDEWAHDAYGYADAMLAERQRRKEARE